MATKHTCGGPVFGRKTPGCPRCDELLAGAQPVRWNIQDRQQQDKLRSERIKNHNCKESGCNVVCTAFDW